LEQGYVASSPNGDGERLIVPLVGTATQIDPQPGYEAIRIANRDASYDLHSHPFVLRFDRLEGRFYVASPFPSVEDITQVGPYENEYGRTQYHILLGYSASSETINSISQEEQDEARNNPGTFVPIRSVPMERWITFYDNNYSTTISYNSFIEASTIANNHTLISSTTSTNTGASRSSGSESPPTSESSESSESSRDSTVRY
jgi:hypothetical protein